MFTCYYCFRKLSIICSTKIYCVSDSVKNQIITLFNCYNKIETLYLGVELFSYNKDKMRNNYSLPMNKTIVSCIAFHNSIKGIDILIKAMEYLYYELNERNTILCQIGGGDTNYFSHLKYLVKIHKIESIIYWMGIINNTSEILSASDIYCQPSLSEGISLSIMESCVAGLPIVASNVGGIPEIVVPDVNGFLIEPKDFKNLANKLFCLIKDKDLRTTMGKKSYEFKDSFLLDDSIRKIIDYYYF